MKIFISIAILFAFKSFLISNDFISNSFRSRGSKTKDVYFFRPQNVTEKVPVVFFVHAYGKDDPEDYQHFIEHIVSEGYAVVFSPPRKMTFTRKQIKKQEIILTGYRDAIRKYAAFVDTSKIGFVGHGFGAGAVPALAMKMHSELGWGKKALFMQLLSSWYMHNITDRQLFNFPNHAQFVIEVFDNDNNNDFQISYDIFKSINLPQTQKVSLVIQGYEFEETQIRADSDTPLSSSSFQGEDNELDSIAIHSVFSTLAKSSFEKDPRSQNILFGNQEGANTTKKFSSNETLINIVSSTNYSHYNENLVFYNPWQSWRNPRLSAELEKKEQKITFYYKTKFITSIFKHLAVSSTKQKKLNDDFDIYENPILEGYGADGIYTTNQIVFEYSIEEDPENIVPVYVYFPKEKTDKSPAIIFAHGYIGQEPDQFQPFINHLVSRGFVVIYPTFPFFPSISSTEIVLQKYKFLEDGALLALKRCESFIDTTRIGFFGQSFGASSIPINCHRLINQHGYGENGVFMFLSAPWYLYGITQEQLENFPEKVKMVMQVYDDDQINDHMIAIDIYENISIAKENKDYMTIYSEEKDGVVFSANHFVPYSVNNIYGQQNYHDYYGVYRIMDALADYAFYNNVAAKKIALGNGHLDQTFMGVWDDNTPLRKMEITDNPKSLHPELKYRHAWENKMNPRRANNYQK